MVDAETREMEGQPVDMKLLLLAKHLEGKIVTGDYNLNKVARLQNVNVVNLNDVANSLKPVFLPGEKVIVRVVKPGERARAGRWIPRRWHHDCDRRRTQLHRSRCSH